MFKKLRPFNVWEFLEGSLKHLFQYSVCLISSRVNTYKLGENSKKINLKHCNITFNHYSIQHCLTAGSCLLLSESAPSWMLQQS